MPIITVVSSYAIYTATALSSVIIGTAIAADMPNNFVSSHPDAAVWVMGVLMTFLVFLVGVLWRRLLTDHKTMKDDFTAAQSLLVQEMKAIAKDIHAVCVEQARIKQHCIDVCDLRIEEDEQ